MESQISRNSFFLNMKLYLKSKILVINICYSFDLDNTEMSGIRIRKIPKDVKEKTLRIHFAKPENGGGSILKIYFPLFNNDAVIIYKDKSGLLWFQRW